MIVRNGTALSIPVLFSSGHPDGDITWRLFGTSGAMINTGVVAVPVDAVSVNLPIAVGDNTLTPGTLFASRDFEWDYLVGGAVVNGAQRYTIEARAPYGASNDGVRAKLGVEPKDLPEGDISLIRSYIYFRDVTTEARLALATGEAAQLSIRDAIEAHAAPSLIPTMAVRIAVSEDSGTNAFKRQPVDWNAVAEYLSGIVNAGILAVDPTYDPTPIGALFIVATPTADPITGSTYV